MIKENGIERREREYRDIGVVFNIERDAKEEVDRLVTLISKEVDLASKTDENRRAHISLFQGRMPHQIDTASLEKLVLDLLNESGPITIEMEDNLFIRPNGNIFWNVKINEDLSKLHIKLLERLQPLTEGLLMTQFQKIVDTSESSTADREQVVKYGSLLAGPSFLPHITLGKLSRLEEGELIKDIKPEPMHLNLIQPAVVELNDDGSLKNYN